MPPVIKVGDQNTLVPTSAFPYAKFDFDHFNPVQSRVFEFYNEETSAVVACPTASGKAQPLDALVLTPQGYCPMGNISEGDAVIGGDGRPTNVVGVYPQGDKLVFRVVFSDDTETQCCMDHLWTIRPKSGGWKTVPLRDIAANFTPDLFQVPVPGPVEFSERPLGLDPYLLGVLLGDGGLGYGARITVADRNVLDLIASLLPEGCGIRHVQKCDYSITGDGQWNEVIYELNRMKLIGLRSHEKFIPWAYLHGSVDQRWRLLQGLMDSDGGMSSGGSPTYETTSRQLAEDVAFLIRSLGGFTRIRTREKTTYRHKGEVRFGRVIYRLTVGLDRNPFGAHSRRKPMYTRKEYHPLKKIRLIKEVGIKPCQCIKVDSGDGLYITDGFVVTHNTTVAEMFLSHEVRKRGGKGMYLAPLRSLAQEKIDDWSEKTHHFSDLDLSICTGDYRITPKRRKELENAQLIMMTSEMLDSQSRNFNEDKCGYLADIGTLVVDESHLLTVPGRGDRLEAGLMRLTELAPKARLVLLSATMPNVDEISDWVAYSLTGKDTRLLVSSYRPCPLNIHYEKYYDGEQSYEENELQKVDYAMQIIEYYPQDKFLIFAHTKRTGELMKQAIARSGLACEFHNADLVKDKRRDLENRFKKDPDFKYLVATSTLAWGVNTPARRVIVLGVHRGMSEVATYDIGQEVGRAGRPKYDPMGDAYVLLPESKFDYHKNRLKRQDRIESQMLADVNGKHKTLAFHLINEIAREKVTERDDVRHWYGRTLASFQSHEMDDAVVDGVVELLRKCGAVREEEGKLKASGIGKVASLFYFTPFDVSDLRKNLTLYFDGEQRDDVALSMALGNTDTYRMGIVSKAEREEMSRYANMVKARLGEGTVFESAVKAGFAYYMLLQGFHNQTFASMTRTIQSDFPRVAQVLQTLDSYSGKWDKREFFKRLGLRVQYGVSEHLVYLCQLPHIGGAKAKALHNAGIRNVKDVIANPTRVKTIAKLGDKRFDEVMAEARKLAGGKS